MGFDLAYTFTSDDNKLSYTFSDTKRSGILKLAEMYVKALVTRQGSNYSDLTYGTFLIDVAGSNSDFQGTMVKTKVIEAVTSATRWLLNMQLNNPTSDDEMLKTVTIVQIEFDLTSNLGKVNITLRLQNILGRTIVAGVAI